MGGVWLWLRRDWRARWRSSLAIAALVAAGAVVLFGLLAAWSSCAAARLRPAEILRTE